MVYRRWDVKTPNEKDVKNLCVKLNAPRLICTVLASRGITQAEDAVEFVNSTRDLPDPNSFADMQKLAVRVRKAVENGEKMVVYGDYDVDGVSATALMVTYLESIGGEVFYKLPSRSDEGYGLSKNIIKSLAQKNIKLIITVDNGVSAIEEIDYANEMGVDVVVTDHHLPKETLPNAIAVVDPLRKDDNSGAKILSGVGVAYMAMCAIEQCSAEEMLEYYADLVAIGTIADIMQLTGINRKIVQKGLQLLQNTERAGLAALFQKCGFTGKKITGENISYAVSPRLNAAGRMDNAAIALNLLLEEDFDTAVELAEKIESYNALRQTTEQKIAEELTAQIQSDPQLISSEVLVVWGKGYHAGVIGIVASRLVERFNKPSIVFTIDENGEAKGSGRSFEGFSLYNAINACSSLCLRFGGHDLAAGLTVMENDLLQFRKNINSWAIENYPVLLRRPLCADATIKIADLTIEEVESLDLLAPFGQGNVSPVFMVENALIDTIYPLSQGKHSRLKLMQGSSVLYAAIFGTAPEQLAYKSGDRVDVLVSLSVYEANSKMLSAKINAIRPAGINEEFVALSEIYDSFNSGVNLDEKMKNVLCPAREDVVAVYKTIALGNVHTTDLQPLFAQLGSDKTGKMLASVDILKELGHINEETINGVTLLLQNQDKVKRPLSESKLLAKLQG